MKRWGYLRKRNQLAQQEVLMEQLPDTEEDDEGVGDIPQAELMKMIAGQLLLDTSIITAVPKRSGSLPEAMTSSARCWLLQRRILWSAWSC